MRWIAWIRLFDFEVKHIPGSKNAVADALSRKPAGPSDQREKAEEEDIDDWVDAQIFTNRTSLPSQAAPEPLEPLKEGYSPHFQAIARYLSTLEEPLEVRPHWRRRLLKKEALKYFLSKGFLWLRPSHDSQLPRRLVDSPEDKKAIFRACHNEMGHKGREATYRRITNHYYWTGMYGDIEDWIRACPDCQAWNPKRYKELFQYTEPSPFPFTK